MHRVFVYGTLRRGAINADRMQGALFERRAVTAPGYALVIVEGYPALVERGAGVVHGEVYVVSPSLIAELDEFEGVPVLYRRDQVRLAIGGAEAYFMTAKKPFEFHEIRGGDYLDSEGLCAALK